MHERRGNRRRRCIPIQAVIERESMDITKKKGLEKNARRRGRYHKRRVEVSLCLLLLLLLVLLVVVVLLVLGLLLCCGFGHQLLEGHEVALFFGIALGLDSKSAWSLNVS